MSSVTTKRLLHSKLIGGICLSALLAVLLFPNLCFALYRGDEFVPRKYNVGSLYFINRISYEYDWRALDGFERERNAYLGAAGSLSGEDLYLYHDLKMSQALGENNEIRLRYIYDRDFCDVYDRFAMSLAHFFSDRWSVELVGEPNSNKEFSDLGGAAAFEGDRHRLRTQVLIPNVVYNDKGDHVARMQRVPNLQAQARSKLGDHWRVAIDTDFDFPRHLIHETDGFEFDFEKYQFDASAIWHPEGASDLIFNLAGEFARKERVGMLRSDERDFSIDRKYWQATVEYGRHLQGATLFRAGISYVHFDEDKIMPNDSEGSLINERNDHIAYAGRTWRVHEGLKLNTMMLANILRDRRESANEDDASTGSPRFQARALGSIIMTGNLYRLEFGISSNLHQSRFGGGFVRIVADF